MMEKIIQAAVLKRASHKDLLVLKNDSSFLSTKNYVANIALNRENISEERILYTS